MLLPTATGGAGSYDYTATPRPAGLSFASGTRRITGTPTTAQTVTVTYTVTDGDNDTATRDFDFVITQPLVLADFDDAGLEVVAAALLEASSPGTSGNDLYVDSDQGGSDTPLDGELGLGPDDTVISRISHVTGGLLRLNDRNNPEAFDIGDYFDTGGDGNDLTLYLQTADDGLVSFAIASALSGSRNAGVVRISLPSDGVALMNGIATGDRWIIAFARPAVVAPSFADNTGDAQTWTLNQAIAPITVPVATGTPTPTYAVRWEASHWGIAFDTGTRVISGTPSDRWFWHHNDPIHQLRGDADWTVDYTTTAALTVPSFADNTGDAQSWTQNQAITSVTVPAANGNPSPTYSAVGALPAGISFDTGTRVLSGTPTVVGSGTITIRATNSEGGAGSTGPLPIQLPLLWCPRLLPTTQAMLRAGQLAQR